MLNGNMMHEICLPVIVSGLIQSDLFNFASESDAPEGRGAKRGSPSAGAGAGTGVMTRSGVTRLVTSAGVTTGFLQS